MTEPTDQQIIELADRIASGDLTQVQYNFWIKQWRIDDATFLDRCKKMEVKKTVATFRACIFCLAMLYFVCWIVVGWATGDWSLWWIFK